MSKMYKMGVSNPVAMSQFRTFVASFRTPVTQVMKRGVASQYSPPPPVMEKPKKPLNGFFRFVAQNKDEFLKNASVYKDVIQMAAKIWADLPGSEKAKYNAAYLKDMNDYKERLLRYTELKNHQERENIRNGFVPDKKVMKEQRKLLGKPTKPPNSFICFSQEFRQTLDKSIPIADALKLARKSWQDLSELEKQRYVAKSKKAFEEYHKKMEEWEERMIQNGYSSLVRAKRSSTNP